VALALMGSSYGETEPRKVTYKQIRAQHSQKLENLTSLENSHRTFYFGSDMSPGNPVVKLVPPNRIKQSNQGNE
jgi:hypothetical protein